ncbi:MAG: protein-glutamate O-methyltransferase CheR [Pirellulaceae bacterium]
MHLTATPSDIEAVSELVHELCGVYLGTSKGYLVETRLSDLATRSGCANFSALVAKARAIMSDDLRREIIDKMTTNETLFFRDSAPFEALQHKVIPNIIDAREKTLHPTRIRIWSAGCSTGQEPYSIAMTIHELIPDAVDWDIRIVGTDVSDEVIRRASTGVYSEHQIQRGLPTRFRDKYFERCDGGWKVKDAVRALVHFQRANLLQPFTSLGTFDVIFCRNVAIYFTPENRLRLFDRFADSLVTDGYFFVGSAEAPRDLKQRFVAEHHCRTRFIGVFDG